MSRMPFRWKHSPLFCQTVLSRIVWPLPDGYLLFHYMDDFLILGPDPVRLRAITVCVVRALEEAGFLVSAKSTLEPVTEIFLSGKYANLGVHTIGSHPRAFLHMFNIWLRLATRSCPSSRLLSKAFGFIHWHFWPRLGGGPLLAGSYCDRWGGFERPTPCKVLHGLCTAIVRCMEPWEPPALARIAIYHSLSAVSDLWALRHCVMFGDVALDAIRYRECLCKPSFKSTKLKISNTFSVVLGIMKGQHVALSGQPLSIMLTTPAFRSQQTMGKTMSSRVGE